MEFLHSYHLIGKNNIMMKKYLLLCLLSSSLIIAQKPIFTSAKVDEVTVYFNSAEISQSTAANLPVGTSEIVVKNVSNLLYEETLLIGAPSHVTVLSAQFTTDYISEYDKDENSPALKSVRDSLNLVNRSLNKIKNERLSANKTIELLDNFHKISGTKAELGITEFTKIIDYYQLKRTELSNNLLALDEKEKNLSRKLEDLNTRLNYSTEKEEKVSKGKLILQVMNNKAGDIPLKISYLSKGASWVPFYDLKAENVSSPIQLLYKAQIMQNTGINWKKVKLTLSSGTPNQNNRAPVLSSWFLRYDYYGGNRDSYLYESWERESIEKKSAQEQIIVSGVGAVIDENQLNISFDISTPYDIISNGKKHSVILNEIKIPATYRHFAVPKLDQESYLLAEIKDYSQYNLLKGEANIIFEGMYVGKTSINPNQTSDTINLSLGRDKRVSIKREKISDKSGTKFLSSNKEQTFTYDIIVRNNKKEAIEITLKDQYPLSSDESIKVELLNDGKASVDKETGILTWKLKLSPNETKKYRISYKVTYPKSKTIYNL